MINTIYIYAIPITLLLTLLTLLDIAYKHKKFNSQKIKKIAEEQAEQLKKYYEEITTLTEEEIKKFNNNLNGKLKNYEELSNKFNKLEKQQKEIIDNNINLQKKYAEATKIITQLENELGKIKGTLRNKTKQIVRLKSKYNIDLNENEKKVFEELKNKENLNA